MNGALVVLPHTGEVLTTLAAPIDDLAAAVLAIEQRERELADARRQIKQELANRMLASDQQLLTTRTGLIVQLATGARRDWDVDDLTSTVRDLIDSGGLQARDVTGLVKTSVTVDGNVARRLLQRVSGTARRQLEACFTWREGPPRLTVSAHHVDAIEATAEDQP